VEFDALARVDIALLIERLVLPELGVQDHRQQVRPSAPTGDRVERRRRLGDGFARTASEFLPHRLDYLPLARNGFQSFGDGLAELHQLAAAARARGGGGDPPAPPGGGGGGAG